MLRTGALTASGGQRDAFVQTLDVFEAAESAERSRLNKLPDNIRTRGGIVVLSE